MLLKTSHWKIREYITNLYKEITITHKGGEGNPY
jgi:hypothetical protein